jgi:hypothetical protein
VLLGVLMLLGAHVDEEELGLGAHVLLEDEGDGWQEVEDEEDDGHPSDDDDEDEEHGLEETHDVAQDGAHLRFGLQPNQSPAATAIATMRANRTSKKSPII